jgi:hypothetical protein
MIQETLYPEKRPQLIALKDDKWGKMRHGNKAIKKMGNIDVSLNRER